MGESIDSHHDTPLGVRFLPLVVFARAPTACLCLHGRVSAHVPVGLRILSWSGWSLLLVVLAVVTLRWVEGPSTSPPSGWGALVLGACGLSGGWLWKDVRKVSWGLGWACLLHVSLELVQVQLRLNRAIPTLYLLLIAGLVLLASACVSLGRLSSVPAPPPRDLV